VRERPLTLKAHFHAKIAEPSEKVMPKQIKATTTDEFFTRKAHNFTHFFAMARSVAMDLAVLTAGLGVEGAAPPALKGIGEEFGTCGAVVVRVCGGQIKISLDQCPPRMMMFAINLGKKRQKTQVFRFFIHH